MKRTIVTLVIAIIFVLICIQIEPNISDNYFGLKYKFNNNIAAQAYGNATILAEDNDKYFFYWGNDNGLLADYSCFDKLQSKANQNVSIEINRYTLIPVSATKIYVIDSDREHKYTVNIPKFKQNNYNKSLYSVGVISDIHFGNREGIPSKYPEIAWNHLTSFFSSQKVSLIIGAGDLSANGLLSDYEKYSKNLFNFNQKNPQIPIYYVTGNHDCFEAKKSLDNFVKKTKDSINYQGIFKRKYYDDDKLDYTVSVYNDIYIFFSQISKDYSVNSKLFSDKQLKWLEQRLEENKNKRVYLVSHSFFPGGAGDATNGIYRYGADKSVVKNSGAGPSFENYSLKRFYEMVNKNNNVVFFSGHSHNKFALQFLSRINKNDFKVNDFRYNIYTNIFKSSELNSSALQVHVPSVSQPRILYDEYDKKSELDKLEFFLQRPSIIDKNEECYLMRVYENCIFLQGYDLVNKKYLAYANYIINYNNCFINN